MPGTTYRPLRYGLIGCGLFGNFCLENYRTLDEIEAVGAADLNQRAAQQTAERFGLAASETPMDLVHRDDIDIVHIATPPFTHVELAKRALENGKHVLCEKPLATKVEDAEELIALAESNHRVLAVNLIMRYNPLCEVVKQIADRRLLGEPLHGFFENYAKDEPLPPSHWFWEPDKSGGIFIEHAVHFFDLFEWWLGSGTVLSACRTTRPGSGIEEQVNCTACYGGNVSVNFYHGFTQASRMDRQEFRLLFERGSLTLHEWVPTRLEILALADSDTADALAELMPADRRRKPESEYAGAERQVMSRHKGYEADGLYRVSGSTGMTKTELYGHIIRSLMADQVRAIVQAGHERRVTEQNGLRSLRLAARASELACGGPQCSAP